MIGVKRRGYRSESRRAQAAETRRRVLASATELFLAEGYGEATIERIARGAKVAPQTVYASFGSKRGILFALLDRMAAEADMSRFQKALAAAAGDPARQLREQIAFNIRFYASGIALIDIARTASGVEPDLGEMWREGEARRRRAQAAVVSEWAQANALASHLSATEATDILWGLSGPDMFRLFVIERRWSKPRFERWLVAMLERALFKPDRPDAESA